MTRMGTYRGRSNRLAALAVLLVAAALTACSTPERVPTRKPVPAARVLSCKPQLVASLNSAPPSVYTIADVEVTNTGPEVVDMTVTVTFSADDVSPNDASTTLSAVHPGQTVRFLLGGHGSADKPNRCMVTQVDRIQRYSDSPPPSP